MHHTCVLWRPPTRPLSHTSPPNPSSRPPVRPNRLLQIIGKPTIFSTPHRHIPDHTRPTPSYHTSDPTIANPPVDICISPPTNHALPPHSRASRPRQRPRLPQHARSPMPSLPTYHLDPKHVVSASYVREATRWIRYFAHHPSIPGVQSPFHEEAVEDYLFFRATT